jgi:L-amino acid N-acyltransferase YncA
MTIRVATPADVAAILAIYAPVVTDTAISFELEPPSPGEMRERILSTLPRYPWLVFDRDPGGVIGYAYAGEYRTRAAYQWSVEVSVYVAAHVRRQGVGRALYAELLAILANLGHFSAYAGITLPNPASVALHEAMGFSYLGAYHNVGFKLGRWHDVGWWERAIRPPHASPGTPTPFSQV